MKCLAKSVVRSTDIEQSARPTSTDRSSGCSNGGKTSNTITYSGAELRDLKVMFPYGYVAGLPTDVVCQTMMNGGTNGSIVGMFDEDRPDVEPREVILYSDGVTFKLSPDGSISIECLNATIKSSGKLDINGDSVNLSSTAKTTLTDADGVIDIDYVIKLKDAHDKLEAKHNQLRQDHDALLKRVEVIEGRLT